MAMISQSSGANLRSVEAEVVTLASLLRRTLDTASNAGEIAERFSAIHDKLSSYAGSDEKACANPECSNGKSVSQGLVADMGSALSALESQIERINKYSHLINSKLG